MKRVELTDEDRLTLWEQYVEVYAESQDSFDTSVRTLAAAAIAVTVSLATALKDFDNVGVAAVSVFVASLSANVLSFFSAQLDMRARLVCVEGRVLDGIDGNRWTRVTTSLNVVAGVTLIVGASLLAWFVASST